MANPRQRRKAKSSAHKAISHSKRAKRLLKKMPAICGPKVLQDAWDPTRTLRQNYLALGLQHDLNPIASGGSEVHLTDQNSIGRQPETVPSFTNDDTRSTGSEAPALPKGFGRIIRDSSGNVVRVELPSDEDAEDAPKGELAIDTPVAATESELRTWVHHNDMERGAGSGGIEDTVVQVGFFYGTRVLTNGSVDLENLAASAAVRERHTSMGERLYLERLVGKYSDDVDKMARDRRLNPEQRTANELRRAIAKAGGYSTLCKGTATKVAG